MAALELSRSTKDLFVFSLGVEDSLKLLSHVRFFVTPSTIAHQAPLPMEFSEQKYWSGVPFPIPGDLPAPGIKPESLASPAW